MRTNYQNYLSSHKTEEIQFINTADLFKLIQSLQTHKSPY